MLSGQIALQKQCGEKGDADSAFCGLPHVSVFAKVCLKVTFNSLCMIDHVLTSLTAAFGQTEIASLII